MKILSTRSKRFHLVRTSCLGFFSTFVFSLTASAVQPLSDSQLQSKDISIVPKTLVSKKRTEACNAEKFTSSKRKKSKSTCSDADTEDNTSSESASNNTSDSDEATHDGDDTSSLAVLSDSQSNDETGDSSASNQYDEAMEALGLDDQSGLDEAEKLAKSGNTLGANNNQSGQMINGSLLVNASDSQEISLGDLKLLGLNLSANNLNLSALTSGLLSLDSNSVTSSLLNSALSFQVKQMLPNAGSTANLLTSFMEKISIAELAQPLTSALLSGGFKANSDGFQIDFTEDVYFDFYIYGSISGDGIYDGLDVEIPSLTTGIRQVKVSGFQRPSLR